jgi:hypothetical protein
MESVKVCPCVATTNVISLIAVLVDTFHFTVRVSIVVSSDLHCEQPSCQCCQRWLHFIWTLFIHFLNSARISLLMKLLLIIQDSEIACCSVQTRLSLWPVNLHVCVPDCCSAQRFTEEVDQAVFCLRDLLLLKNDITQYVVSDLADWVGYCLQCRTCCHKDMITVLLAAGCDMVVCLSLWFTITWQHCIFPISVHCECELINVLNGIHCTPGQDFVHILILIPESPLAASQLDFDKPTHHSKQHCFRLGLRNTAIFSLTRSQFTSMSIFLKRTNVVQSNSEFGLIVSDTASF